MNELVDDAIVHSENAPRFAIEERTLAFAVHFLLKSRLWQTNEPEADASGRMPGHRSEWGSIELTSVPAAHLPASNEPNSLSVLDIRLDVVALPRCRR